MHAQRPWGRDESPTLGEVLELAHDVLSELDPEVVLGRLVELARDLTGAKYGAIGVLNESGDALARFITSGIDEATRRSIGPPPRGRGVLGELIDHPEPLRLPDVDAHPNSYGYPPGHPRMKSFLGVPVLVGGRPFGNLYLADRDAGEPFTDADEQALVLLADLAGVAIDNARRYTEVEAQRSELERTVEALDATVQIARAVGGETDLETVLALVAKRGRALVRARTLVIERERAGEMIVAAAAGVVPDGLVGRALDLRDSVAGAALRTLQTLRLEDDPNRRRFERYGLGQHGIEASGGLVVPMVFRGVANGVLLALDRIDDGPSFTADDQRLLEAFAASAATAVATADSVETDRQRQRLAAAEAERARWARELHDETLQNLAGMRIAIESARRETDPAAMADMLGDALELLTAEISGLRSLIADVRPPALDDLGLGSAIGSLADRAAGHGLEVELNLDLAYEQRGAPTRLSTELETALYRITQEALTNARKHGGARQVQVHLSEDESTVSLSIRDDGHGFDMDARSDGFGLIGMRERTALLAGTIELDSAPGRGTSVTARFPVRRAGPGTPKQVWRARRA